MADLFPWLSWVFPQCPLLFCLTPASRLVLSVSPGDATSIALFIAFSGGALAGACSLGAPLRRCRIPPCSRWGQSAWPSSKVAECGGPWVLASTPQGIASYWYKAGRRQTHPQLPRNQEKEVLHSRGTRLLVSSWLQLSAPRWWT